MLTCGSVDRRVRKEDANDGCIALPHHSYLRIRLRAHEMRTMPWKAFSAGPRIVLRVVDGDGIVTGIGVSYLVWTSRFVTDWSF